MAKISTATAYFPGELTYAGTKVIHTAQKINMLKVMNFASLKLSGRFLLERLTESLLLPTGQCIPAA